MFGGLPTPTETEAPENGLNAVSSDFQHVDTPESDDNIHNLPLTSSQSGHITLSSSTYYNSATGGAPVGSPLLYYEPPSTNHHWISPGLNNSPTLEPHTFGNSTIMAMRYNTPTTPTSPLTRKRLPPYASTYGDFGSASGWSNVSSPTFDATGGSHGNAAMAPLAWNPRRQFSSVLNSYCSMTSKSLFFNSLLTIANHITTSSSNIDCSAATEKRQFSGCFTSASYFSMISISSS